METLKQSKKVFSQLGFCYIIGTAIIYLLQWILSALIGKYHPQWMQSTDFNLIFGGITVYACGMPFILLLTSRMEKDVIERRKMKWWQFALAFIICYSLVYVSNFAGIAITTFVGILKGSPVQNGLLDVVTGGNIWINFVVMVVVAPIVEEYVFRKVIVDRTVRYGQGIAIAASGLMFALYHGNLNQFAYAVVLGCFFAFIYVKTGNLKITIAMHAIVNFMGSIVAGQLMKLLAYDELMTLDLTDAEALMQHMTEHTLGWLLFGLYALGLFTVVIAGIVLFVIAIVKKRFVFESERMQLPKGKGFQALILNPGMLVFCAIWLVLIVMQLFQ